MMCHYCDCITIRELTIVDSGGLVLPDDFDSRGVESFVSGRSGKDVDLHQQLRKPSLILHRGFIPPLAEVHILYCGVGERLFDCFVSRGGWDFARVLGGTRGQCVGLVCAEAHNVEHRVSVVGGVLLELLSLGDDCVELLGGFPNALLLVTA